MAMKPRAMKKMKDGGKPSKKATKSEFNKMVKSLGLTKEEVLEMLGLPTSDASGVKRGYRGIKRGGMLKKTPMRGGGMMPKKKMMRGGMSKKKK
jgi:hypothetical protein